MRPPHGPAPWLWLALVFLLLGTTRPQFSESVLAANSFKAPFGKGAEWVDNWDFGGSAHVNEKLVRLTPAIRQRHGWIFNRRALEATGWSIDVKFRVNNAKGSKHGGEGFALWVVRDFANDYQEGFHADHVKTGDIFGYHQEFDGLGVFFDTHDDDGKDDNPSISALVSDGTKHNIYDKAGDGWESQLAGCVVDYRGPTVVSVKVRWRSRASVFVMCDV